MKRLSEDQTKIKRKKIWFDAVIQKNIETIQRMISEGFDVKTRQNDAPNGWTALHLACYRGHIEMAKLLLDNGADINSQEIDGWTPLHRACDWGNINTAKFLINRGADVTAKSKNGDTPLDKIKRNNPQKYEELMEWLAEQHPEKVLELMASENIQGKGVGL